MQDNELNSENTRQGQLAYHDWRVYRPCWCQRCQQFVDVPLLHLRILRVMMARCNQIAFCQRLTISQIRPTLPLGKLRFEG